jgi:hypothetical protein
MPKAPAAITSPKLKKLAAKAMQSPSMLTTVETRELGASVLAYVSPPKDVSAVPAEKAAAKKVPADKSPITKS